ncbi:hypothetical protein AgCh_001665 [Apium graveolens]
MKRKYIMLTLLIPGPKEAGNNIDVYLQPLIEDLKLLWDQGEKMYDTYSQIYFNLRAMILCTISDFPGYGNLSGYTIKRAKACPICEDATIDLRLKNCKKNVYMGHHTFLPLTHPYRKRKNDFDGTIETRVAHFPLTGKEVFERVKDIDVVLRKRYKKPTPNSIWKKRSIFWDLPYWEHLQVRHCLDFMHIEKNVCESIIGTLLNIPGKTKDGMKARLDLQELGVRAELAPQQSGKRAYLPPACYTLSRKEKISFCECLSSVNVPSGYSSNPKNLVSMKDLKLLASTDPVGIPRSHHKGRLDGQGTVGHKMITPGAEMLDRAHLFVLQHMTEVNPYLQEHILEIRRKNPSKGGKWVTNEHNRSFVKWFKDRVMSQYSKSPSTVSNTLKWLAYGPNMPLSSFQGYDINGYSFYTQHQDNKSTVQNSGISVEAFSTKFERGNSIASRDVKKSCYGVIEEIWEIDYKDFKVALFKCKWFDIRRGVRVDESGFTLVDFNRFGHEDDPFILATQVKQLFYIRDPADVRWSIVL